MLGTYGRRGGVSDVTIFGSNGSNHTVRAGCDAISAVKLSQQLTAEIDSWAEAHQIGRSDAIRQLVELGLSVAPHPQGRHDPDKVEELAIRQISLLLDPSLASDERERRIRRLIEGPPEFSNDRVDLPRQKA
jgi:hypothetical protein